MGIGVHLMYAMDYGMDWWSGISANQYCQNSPSWQWQSCNCCLTIARFNWTVMSSLFSSLDHTQTHTRNVLRVQFLPRNLHLSPQSEHAKVIPPSSDLWNWSSMHSLILYFAYLHLLCTSPGTFRHICFHICYNLGEGVMDCRCSSCLDCHQLQH